jgi:hypothetical protein
LIPRGRHTGQGIPGQRAQERQADCLAQAWLPSTGPAQALRDGYTLAPDLTM